MSTHSWIFTFDYRDNHILLCYYINAPLPSLAVHSKDDDSDGTVSALDPGTHLRRKENGNCG